MNGDLDPSRFVTLTSGAIEWDPYPLTPDRVAAFERLDRLIAEQEAEEA